MEFITPEKLKTAITQDKLVLFIGAGCSIPLGFPTWKDLTLKILNKLNEKHGEFSEINFRNIITKLENDTASVFNALDKIESDTSTSDQYKTETKQFINELFEQIDITNYESPLHSLLWDVSSKMFTTNYDKVIEKYIPAELQGVHVFENSNKFQSRKSQEDDSKFLYKFHGDYQNPDSIILFSSDYLNTYNSMNHNEDTLRSFFKDKTFLFIGFSLSDPFVNKLFENVKKLYNGYSNTEHFVFTTKSEDYSKYDITSIRIEDYGKDLLNYLSKLKLIKQKNIENSTTNLSVTTSKPEDLNTLNELFKNKTNQLKANPSDSKLYNEIKDIEAKIKKLLFGEFNYLHKISPIYKNVEIHSLFDKVYSSAILSEETLERIMYIRSNSQNYNWYDRSV